MKNIPAEIIGKIIEAGGKIIEALIGKFGKKKETATTSEKSNITIIQQNAESSDTTLIGIQNNYGEREKGERHGREN